MDLIPLGDRVIVKPDPRPTETASGLALVEEGWRPEYTGVIVSMGQTRHPLADEACSTAARLETDITEALWEDRELRPVVEQAASLLRRLSGPAPEVAVGDRVIFGSNAGMVTRINEERYFVMRQSDILAVLG